MRKLLSLVLLPALLPCVAIAYGENRAPLTRVQDVKTLSNAEAAYGLPVKIEATVTYVRPSETSLFVVDNGYGIYVRFGDEIGLLAGDRIAVTGYTEPSFRPIIHAKEVRFLRHGDLPVPQQVRFEDLIKSKLDSQYVQITGHVLAASLEFSQPQHALRFRVKVPDGTIEGFIAHPGKLRSEDLLDADVRMTGVAGGEYGSKMQLAGMRLNIDSWQGVEILHKPASDPWSLPSVSMDQVVSGYRYSNQSQRVRIAGTLTYFEPGTLAVVEQAGGLSMLVKTRSNLRLDAGAGVEVIGFPAIADEDVQLDDAQLRPAAQSTQIEPRTISWEDASVGKYAYNLVAMEGDVVGVVHDSRIDLFIILAGGHLFSATLRHNSADASFPTLAPSMPTLGSRIRVKGVCFVDAGNHWRDRLWFDVRMRSLEDVVILNQPSWWTVKRMTYVVLMLSGVILIAVIWVGTLDRQLRRQSAILARQSQEDAIRERTLARQEQHRSHILELISSSAPLQEVLQEIQAMVSSRLFGSSCWFELHADGVTRRELPEGGNVVSQELFSRDGASLGFLLAIPVLRNSPQGDVAAALLAGARVAGLAIDTRRLYSDLHHRSEYDLLTDLPNRFSMEKKLDQLMTSARRNEGVFGLIYVDLDRFKQVNDRFGHRTGDLYLQEVTRRMKLQLRTGDVLARIGGDEFIALVPILHGRADAEEIAMRLERCFDEPFELDGASLCGSASVGLAVYPEDGASEEELQRSADAAMYANKEGKQPQDKLAAEIDGVGSDVL